MTVENPGEPDPSEFSVDPEREAYINGDLERLRNIAEGHAASAFNPAEGSAVSPEQHAASAVEAATRMDAAAEAAGERYDSWKAEKEDRELATRWLAGVGSEVTSDQQQATLTRLRAAAEGPNPQFTRMLADLERATETTDQDHRISTARHPSRRVEQLVGFQILLDNYNK